jgi:hypothetical protein
VHAEILICHGTYQFHNCSRRNILACFQITRYLFYQRIYHNSFVDSFLLIPHFATRKINLLPLCQIYRLHKCDNNQQYILLLYRVTCWQFQEDMVQNIPVMKTLVLMLLQYQDDSINIIVVIKTFVMIYLDR